MYQVADCTHYYTKAIDRLIDAGINEPTETFWAGVFVGICEQVMMKVKPAGMMASEMPHYDEITEVISDVYGLHRVRLDRPGTDKFEIWVCRKNDPVTITELSKLGSGGLSWGDYHRLRGKLCGYSDDLIKAYTEGTWP